MEKQKRWQFYLIIAVLILTLYNILPTIFFYSNPLKAPIDAPRAEKVASSIIYRINELEKESKEWLQSFCRLLGVNPLSIDFSGSHNGLIQVVFKNDQDAALFRRFLPRAGALIPFVPAQLELSPESAKIDNTHVLVQRRVALKLDSNEIDQLFQFTSKFENDKKITGLYRDIVNDRLMQIISAIAGPSKQAIKISSIVHNQGLHNDEAAITLAKQIIDVDSAFGRNHEIAKRYYASFSQVLSEKKENFAQKFLAKLEEINKKTKKQREAFEQSGESAPFSNLQEQELSILNNQIQVLDKSINILHKNIVNFQQGLKPLTESQIHDILTRNRSDEPIQYVSLEGSHPLIKGLTVNWDSSQVALDFYEDIQQLRSKDDRTEKEAFVKEKINQLIIDDIAHIVRLTDESFKPKEDTFLSTWII